MKNNMKHSGIEWIGDIPSDWEVKRLGFLFTFGKGLGITKENLQDEGIPCVNYGEIHSKYGFEVDPAKNTLRCVGEDYLKTEQNSLLKYGDFVFADTSEDIEGSGNFTYLKSDEKTFAGYHTIFIRAKEQVNHRYIAYLFDSIPFRTQIREKVWGIKVYSITKQILKNAKMILPPPEEQKAIATLLDSQCSKADGIITELELQIEILKQYRVSLITETVTKGLKKNVPMKNSGIEWIERIPKHWKVKKLKYLFKIICGSTPESNNTEYWDGEIPWITPADMPNFGVIKNGERSITKKGYNSCGTSILPKGSIVISTRAPIGKINITQTELCTNQGCKSLVSLSVHAEYSYYLLYAVQEELIKEGKGTTFIELGTFELGNFYVLVPELSEQKAIANFLDKKCEEVMSIIEEKQKSINTIKEYKKSLIYEYVTGKKRIKRK
jgi:type I restriction enzyme S subunit